MRVLFWNVGYARSLDGSANEWLRHGHQVFFHSKEDQIQQLDKIIGVVKEVAPDVFTYAEILNGSLRNHYFNQQEYLVQKLSCPVARAERKYSSSLLSRAPFHSGNANGTCALSESHIEDVHLRSGGKTLVQKITLNDWVIFSVHLSLVFSIRKRQLSEITEHVHKVPKTYNVVVCGDFNIFRGNEELTELLLKTGLTLSTELDNTFPAHNPTVHLDHVLYRLKESGVVKIETLPVIISDHRPVLCTFSN